jgi:molybdenum cofactor cytidylyltransferase
MNGANKLLLPWGNSTLIDSVCEAVGKAEFDEIIIVTNATTNRKMKIPSGFHTVINDNYLKGMTSSIQKGVAASHINTDGYMICLGDQPMISVALYESLRKTISQALTKDKKSIVVPTYKKKKGNPVAFSSHYREQILAHTDPDGCKGVIESNMQHVIKFEVDTDSIHKDIDTPSEYTEVKKQFHDI